MNTKNKQTEILERLSHFHGSTEIYRVSPLFPDFCISEGVRYLRDEAECHWLIDDIAAMQIHPKIRQHPKLKEEQFWSLVVNEDRSATLKCEWDTGKTVYSQHIGWTDFPLNSIKIWVAPGQFSTGKPYILAYLPSER